MSGTGQGLGIEKDRQDKSKQEEQGSTAQIPQSKRLLLVQRMFEVGQADPESVAEIINDNRADEGEIMNFLHGTVGNGFVQQVLAIPMQQKYSAPIIPAFPTNSADSSPDKPKRPQPTQAKGFDEYAVKPEGKRETPLTLDTHHALDGTDVTKIGTKEAEAALLNQVRHSTKRFEASSLKAAQEKLTVSNASGAFNTETIRALLDKTGGTLDKKENAKHPEKKLLTVADIMSPAVWVPWYPDAEKTLFMDEPDIPKDVDADTTATTVADKAAQGMGAKSYRDYYDRVLQPFPKFLGKDVRGGRAHPDLISRLRAAEKFLINYYKGKKDNHNKPITEERIPEMIGWSGDLVTIYHQDPDTMQGGQVVTKGDPEKGIKEVRKGGTFKPTHFHNMGLAVDFDPAKNPYIFDQSDPQSAGAAQTAAKNAKERKDSQDAHKSDPSVDVIKESDQVDPHAAGVEAMRYYDNMARAAYKQAADLYGGEPLSQDAMMKWSQNLSSEELHAKVMQASKSMSQYLTDGEAAAKEGATGPANDKILNLFAQAGYAPDRAKAGLAEMKSFPKDFWHIMSRDGASNGKGTNKATNTQSLELTVALRDAGGLMWGGTEMSHGDNGDFMHFDLRQDAVGQRFINSLSSAKK